MRSILPLTLLLLIACDRTLDASIACERTRADALERCNSVRVTVHRASCVQAVAEAFGACLTDAGDLERGRAEACFGGCDFERVLCQEAVELRDLELDCDTEALACEDACRAARD